MYEGVETPCFLGFEKTEIENPLKSQVAADMKNSDT
jgi:hypothetical protein